VDRATTRHDDVDPVHRLWDHEGEEARGCRREEAEARRSTGATVGEDGGRRNRRGRRAKEVAPRRPGGEEGRNIE
jgi:hypothetical protein